MEPKFNTTFIPKKSLQADVGGSVSGGKFVGRREVKGPGFYLGLMVFLVSIIASLGVFGYTKIVENSIAEKIVKLEQQKNAFDEETVALLTRADSHISNAKKILMSHIAATQLFALLETITLTRVQYTELEYEALPGENALVTLSGISKNFQDVALQVEQYRIHEMMFDPIVQELKRLENKMISFTVDVASAQRLTSFSSALQSERMQVSAPVDTTVAPLDIDIDVLLTEEEHAIEEAI